MHRKNMIKYLCTWSSISIVLFLVLLDHFNPENYPKSHFGRVINRFSDIPGQISCNLVSWLYCTVGSLMHIFFLWFDLPWPTSSHFVSENDLFSWSSSFFRTWPFVIEHFTECNDMHLKLPVFTHDDMIYVFLLCLMLSTWWKCWASPTWAVQYWWLWYWEKELPTVHHNLSSIFTKCYHGMYMHL